MVALYKMVNVHAGNLFKSNSDLFRSTACQHNLRLELAICTYILVHNVHSECIFFDTFHKHRGKLY